MGVTGLWKLIEPSGKPVPLETLENKVLAVDISIWIHQVIKGYQDSRGATVPNAHLLGLFNRLCKLLYYRVKPIFVFDGGVPTLKIQTIAKRSQLKNKYVSESERLQQQLLNTLAKHKAVKQLLKGQIKNVSPKKSPEKALKKTDKEEDLFKLPPMEIKDVAEEVFEDSSSDSTADDSWTDLHTVDVESKDFKSLPLETRHDILMDLKESRKQSSWGRLHELPEESDDFSSFQMRRLRKRRAVQMSLDGVEKEMGGHALSMSDLERILTDEGILAAESSACSQRIVSDDGKKYLYIKDLKEALKQAKKNLDQESNDHVKNKLAKIDEVDSDNELETVATNVPALVIKNSTDILSVDNNQKTSNECFFDTQIPSTSTNNQSMEEFGVEYDEDLEAAIRLSLQTENKHDESLFAESFNETLDESINKNDDNTHMALARAYMLENSDLTQHEIHKIISGGSNRKKIRTIGQHEIDNDMILKAVSRGSSQVPSTQTEINIVKKVSNQTSVNKGTDVVIIEAVDPITKNTKILQKSDSVQEISSDSDDDFVVVLPDTKGKKSFKSTNNKIDEKSNDVLNISSDSESEFVEVTSKSTIEIIIDKANIKHEDDIFADIFENSPTKELESAEKILDSTVNDAKEELKDNILEVSVSNQDTEEDIKEEEKESTPSQNDKIDEKPYERVINKNIAIEVPQCENHSSEIETVIPVSKPVIIPEMSVQDLKEMSCELEKETNMLIVEKSKQDRMGNSITEHMTNEIQELLQLFGIPYIIAPMEAEAQCAFLNDIKLTDGTITDDSDIWLFGGKTVYKNFFDQKKYVMEFKSENIYNHFKLSREQLIQFALLVGSDYTTGIQGVGPVTALEILAAFPSEDGILSGLTNFKVWFENGLTVGPGKTALKTKLKKISLTGAFPSLNVVKAYLEPEVETSKEHFRWGSPDLSELRDYTRTKFGWTTAKTEDILKPVIAKMNIKQTQKSIKDYFHIRDLKIGSVDKLSKRVQLAVDKLSGKIVDEKIDAEKKGRGHARKQNPKKETAKQSLKSNTKTGKANKRLSKEVIPQRERDKSELMKNKMKAIEVFRKSKQGPGFMKKGKSSKNEPLSDANLSESSDE